MSAGGLGTYPQDKTNGILHLSSLFLPLEWERPSHACPPLSLEERKISSQLINSFVAGEPFALG